jgi:hypothetical protein
VKSLKPKPPCIALEVLGTNRPQKPAELAQQAQQYPSFDNGERDRQRPRSVVKVYADGRFEILQLCLDLIDSLPYAGRVVLRVSPEKLERLQSAELSGQETSRTAQQEKGFPDTQGLFNTLLPLQV